MRILPGNKGAITIYVEVKKTGPVGLNVKDITDFKQQVTDKAKIEVGDIQNNVGQMVAKTQGYARFP